MASRIPKEIEKELEDVVGRYNKVFKTPLKTEYLYKKPGILQEPDDCGKSLETLYNEEGLDVVLKRLEDIGDWIGRIEHGIPT